MERPFLGRPSATTQADPVSEYADDGLNYRTRRQVEMVDEKAGDREGSSRSVGDLATVATIHESTEELDSHETGGSIVP